ncbi:hypothetical protein F5Y00DRAFT_260145 [Daldinia vernicosa]|uniref:uncharacterized protein n=1 Tax=Daldinia vernicosa TaxID=114800 RepID=UPI002007DFA8|nr:uncharacterized protein F5Y00DRAFT_260145 [Daldinia vernicosa]KAI0850696.1 hypothetical protein F5Y00DRAFT_260145 [Daldinia vernicosa]
MSILSKAILSSLMLSSALATDSTQTGYCPGVRVVDSGISGCCVGGHIDTPYLSVCDGWPICQGPTTTTQTTTPLSCATFVNDGPSYTEVIASISGNLQAITTSFGTTLDSQAVPTTTGTGEATSKTSEGAAASETSEGAAADSVPRMALAGGGILAAAAAAFI